ncbi:MAG: hypothetical protein DIU64_003055 [Caldicoprobacter oshimai]
MIFIGDFTQDEKGLRVGFIHYMPFHPKYGLGKTEEELKQTGVLIDSIPEPEVREDKIPVLYYNPNTNSVYYEYEDSPLTEQERIAMLEQAIIELTMLLGGGN